jgi:hypothetical protein
MKILLIVFLFIFPSAAFASGDGFFGGVFTFFGDFWYFITVSIPSAVDSFFVYLATYALYLKFYFIKESLEFSHSVAVTFLDMVSIRDVVHRATTALPTDLRQISSDIGFFEALSLVVEAMVTRFVYQMSW